MRLQDRAPAQLVTLAILVLVTATSLAAQEATPEQKARAFGQVVGGCLVVVIAIGVAIAILKAVFRLLKRLLP